MFIKDRTIILDGAVITTEFFDERKSIAVGYATKAKAKAEWTRMFKETDEDFAVRMEVTSENVMTVLEQEK